MSYSFYVIDHVGNRIPVHIRSATQKDFERTKSDGWASDWTSDFIRDPALEKYAFVTKCRDEVIALGAYYDDKQGISIFISYAEAHPASNPTIVVKKEDRLYYDIGKMVIAFGVQLSLERGYDGTVYFKALSTELYHHFKRDYGAVDIPAGPHMLIIFDDIARNLLNTFAEEEGQ